MRNILHRDISLNNLLLGTNEEGNRGIILDLDMSITTNEHQSDQDFRTVRPFSLGLVVFLT